MTPEYWQDFVAINDIVGKAFELDEKSDLSTMGADMNIMTEAQCIDEATECYPGIIAVKTDFIPVAMCTIGSGDYYYINKRDGKSGALYRIYHDAICDDELETDGIEKVLENYEQLLSHQST